jgi:hypothetical protein
MFPPKSKTVPPSRLCLECVAAKRQMPIQIHSTLVRRQRRRTHRPLDFGYSALSWQGGDLYAARSRDEEIVRFFRSPMGSETEFIQLQQYNAETFGHAKHKVSRSSFSCWPWSVLARCAESFYFQTKSPSTVPTSLKSRFAEIAKHERRSLSKQVELILERCLELGREERVTALLKPAAE